MTWVLTWLQLQIVDGNSFWKSDSLVIFVGCAAWLAEAKLLCGSYFKQVLLCVTQVEMTHDGGFNGQLCSKFVMHAREGELNLDFLSRQETSASCIQSKNNWMFNKAINISGNKQKHTKYEKGSPSPVNASVQQCITVRWALTNEHLWTGPKLNISVLWCIPLR